MKTVVTNDNDYSALELNVLPNNTLCIKDLKDSEWLQFNTRDFRCITKLIEKKKDSYNDKGYDVDCLETGVYILNNLRQHSLLISYKQWDEILHFVKTNWSGCKI